MSAEEVAILADDLTGALDAAAPFARASRRVAVVWGERPPPTEGAFALDSETREMSPRHAEAFVARLLPYLAGRTIALKKVDSLLRGNSFGEVAACWKGGLFRSLVVAPAFPAQNRMTRNGTQFARVENQWRPVAPDLVASLRVYGVAARAAGPSAAIAGEGVVVCDAETDDDLRAIAEAGRGLVPPVLWCGSAGLARALACSTGETVPAGGRRRLVVVGTRHPVSVAQVERLAAVLPDAIATIAALDDIGAATGRIGELLEGQASAALVFRLPPLAPAEAAAVMERAFAALSRLGAPDLLAVTGGETLIRLCAALSATRLDVFGEWRPGIPVARIADGAWAGTQLVSKSGAFGTGDVLAALAATHGAA